MKIDFHQLTALRKLCVYVDLADATSLAKMLHEYGIPAGVEYLNLVFRYSPSPVFLPLPPDLHVTFVHTKIDEAHIDALIASSLPYARNSRTVKISMLVMDLSVEAELEEPLTRKVQSMFPLLSSANALVVGQRGFLD